MTRNSQFHKNILFSKKTLFLSIILSFLLIMMTTGLGCKERGDSGDGAVELSEPEPTVTSPAFPSSETTPPVSLPASPSPVPPTQDRTTNLDNELDELARDFTVVWGTFSATTNCQNIRELLDDMSEYFRRDMEEYLEDECSQSYTGPLFGWQTEVLETVILDQDDYSAKILVVTERKRSGDYVKTYYPNLILELVVETDARGEEEWKVEEAYWSES